MAHLLLVQFLVIFVTARLLGFLVRGLAQPPVVGEMLSGFVLGPLCLGHYSPSAFAWLFPVGNLDGLAMLSELGVVLFMFVVGAELRLGSTIGSQFRAGAVIAVFSLSIPFLAGAAVSPFLFERLPPPVGSRLQFGLFVGIVFSVTAFPVLARLIKDRGMMATEVGQIALTAAAFAEVTAFAFLTVVLTSLQADGRASIRNSVVLELAGLVALAAVTFFAVSPLLRGRLHRSGRDGKPDIGTFAVLLGGAIVYAVLTQQLGAGSAIGAFLFGLAMPRDDRLVATLTEPIEHLAIVIFLPCVFASAGLNLAGRAFSGAGTAVICLVLVLAVLSKMIGGILGARLAGRSWRTAFGIATLTNARGLIEIVILKIGLDAGAIGKDLFTVFMIMTVVTTLMASPMLDLVLRRGVRAAPPCGAS